MKACPIMPVQQMISGKYKLRIIWDLRDGPLRYGQLKKGLLRGLPGSVNVSARVLTHELKTLAAMGMVNRIDFRVKPARVEYSLTSRGKSLIPAIATLHDWSVRHLVESVAASAVVPLPGDNTSR
jgi:DNA-binding HxlR family transcriptional regulator